MPKNRLDTIYSDIHREWRYLCPYCAYMTTRVINVTRNELGGQCLHCGNTYPREVLFRLRRTIELVYTVPRNKIGCIRAAIKTSWFNAYGRKLW